MQQQLLTRTPAPAPAGTGSLQQVGRGFGTFASSAQPAAAASAGAAAEAAQAAEKPSLLKRMVKVSATTRSAQGLRAHCSAQAPGARLPLPLPPLPS